MAQKLSLLIFSRNDIKDALRLIKDLYSIADEIVMVDSSERKLHDELVRTKSRSGLGKLRIFYVIPMGYPDPIRMWALKKCRHQWVLLLDTDEKLSDEGKGLVKELISGTDASAFAIKRYEEYTERSRGAFFTWQLRLFRKRDVKFRGIVHEQPVVNGLVERTSDYFYIAHIASLKGRSSADYRKMEVFDRMSYGVASERMLEYFGKVVVPKEGSMKDRASGRLLQSLLASYKKLKFRSDDHELSDFDYFWFFAIVDLGYRIKDRHYRYIPRIYSDRKGYVNIIRDEKRKADSKEMFEISKIVNTVGITQYLGLDSDRTIARLNRKYADAKGGSDLLIRLLKERHEKGKRWLD